MKPKDNLHDFREKQNMTLAEMAAKLGISQSMYEKIEGGRRGTSYKFIRKFQVAFPDADIILIFFADPEHKELLGNRPI
jgi:transcriptional regulator with XRE-family HTH domain